MFFRMWECVRTNKKFEFKGDYMTRLVPQSSVLCVSAETGRLRLERMTFGPADIVHVLCEETLMQSPVVFGGLIRRRLKLPG